jgi:hypothetical protein
MTSFKDRMTRFSPRTRLGLGAAALLAAGVAGGAGAVSLTRPAAVMAPIATTSIAQLPSTNGIVTIKGRVAEVFGDRFVVQDQTGRAMIDAGRLSASQPAIGQTVSVQGRYDNGQLRPSYLVGPDGSVSEIGPKGHHGRGPGRPHGGRDDGPPPRPGCDAAAAQPGAPPPAATAPAPGAK